MWRTLVQQLASWVGTTTSDLVLCDIIERYLMGQGEVTMTDCPESNASQTHKMLAQTHDNIGYDNIVEGRICKFFLWRWWYLCFLGGHE